MNVNVKLMVGGLILAFCLCSCTEETADFPIPDVSNMASNVEVLRFDRDLMAVDTNNVAAELNRLDREYGSFTKDFLRQVIPVRRGDFGPEEQQNILRAFIRYPLIQELDRRVQERFTDDQMAEQEAKLEQALRFFKFYLPQAEVPDTLVAYQSQLQYAAFLYGDGQLAIGLDFFLGPDFNYQTVDAREAIFSDYLALSYTPDHLTEKLMRILIEDYVPRPRSGRLVDYILYEGKKLFLLDRVLPKTPDHILHEITEEQMTWLERNEIAIYAQLQKDKQFYSTDPGLARKLTQPAPYSQGMPRESPGQAVNYLGRKIVESYVQANPQVTMEELMAIEDGQELLEGARYKPR